MHQAEHRLWSSCAFSVLFELWGSAITSVPLRHQHHDPQLTYYFVSPPRKKSNADFEDTLICLTRRYCAAIAKIQKCPHGDEWGSPEGGSRALAHSKDEVWKCSASTYHLQAWVTELHLCKPQPWVSLILMGNLFPTLQGKPIETSSQYR